MPIRGEAAAKLANGKTLTLAVNFATLARAAAQLGIPAGEVFDVVQDQADPRQMLAALAMMEQALRRHHPGVDEDALGDLMLTDGQVLVEAMKIAMVGAFGDPEPEGKDGPNPPKRGTSTPSNKRGPKRDKTRGSSGTKPRVVS